MKILLIEDDKYTAATLTASLTEQHYLVDAVADGQTAMQLVQTYDYDLLVLDVMLPRLDGISLCCYLRVQGYQMPILLLTAKDSISDRVLGLKAGADDYLVKPFDMAELIARIQALLRRRGTILPGALTWGDLQLFPNARRVTWKGKLVNLTAKEYRLLELFLENPLRIFSKDVILDRLWHASESPGEGTVASHVKGIRQKLKAAGVTAEVIETIYGLGYRLKPPPDGLQPVPEASSPPSTQTDRTQAQQEVMAEAAEVWEEMKASLKEEMALFEQAIADLSRANLDQQLRQQALALAHQLVGALGSLGSPSGSGIARQIEQLLQGETTLEQVEALRLKKLVDLLKQALETTPLVVTKDPPKATSARLLVIDDDVMLTKAIAAGAIAAGFQVEVATTLADGRRAIAQNRPDVILLDLNFNNTSEDGLTLLAELDEQNSIPVLVFTVRDSLTDRVAVARLGGRAFLHKPISTSEVLSAVTQVLNFTPTVEAKVMIVDDDPQILELLSQLLPPWGLHVITLADPQRFWEVLTTSAPDLLILDVFMPRFSGLELCKVVRHDPHWANLPILMLTAYGNADVIYQVFAAGADDYVSKPIVAPELIARIVSRLERSRLRHQSRS